MSRKTEKQPEICDRPCPCGGVLTRPEPWDSWRCDTCCQEWMPCLRCGTFMREERYSQREKHGIEDCLAALGERMAALEVAARLSRASRQGEP